VATGISPLTRETVHTRDDITCQWCGLRVNPHHGRYSLQHRLARGMGGSSNSRINSPENLVFMCGSATTGCHGHVESHPTEAAARGFRLGPNDSPTDTPIIDYMGQAWFLYEAGHRSMFAPSPSS
jgi:hypothetical protein